MSKTKMFLLREAERVNRCSSKVVVVAARASTRPEKLGNAEDSDGVKLEDSPYWVPHPRTGIYFPKGHESVMDDVPEGAASLNDQFQTYWLRNVDGVEKPAHDDHHFLGNNFY